MPFDVRQTRILRSCIGAVACVVLPVASRLDGSGALAWTMYSRSSEFRIDFVTTDAAGRRRSRNPTALAERASPGASSLLAGSDHWRPGASIGALRDHLDGLADVACDETGAAAVELTLSERTAGLPDRSTTSRRGCTR